MILEIFLIGLALAMDASAVAIANSTAYKDSLNKKCKHAMPVLFSLFQFFMPLLGYLIGSNFKESLLSVSGYLSASVFFVLSAKIVLENFGNKKQPSKKRLSFLTLIVQAIATSIDAFVIGITFSATVSSPFIACVIIGFITFFTVLLAVKVGKILGESSEKYADLIGASILFILSIKSLLSAI